VIIIEAKIRPDPGAISQLKLYGQLFPKTPEFKQLKHLPVKLMLVVAYHDPEVEELCKREGIEYRFFSPPWVKLYWKEKLERR